MDDLRGLFGFTERGAGGSVDERSGGDRAREEGSSSRCIDVDV